MALLLLDDQKRLRVQWLFLDRFLTDRTAGTVNGTAAEPGPETRTVTDTASKAEIVGGQYKVTAITVGTRDPKLRYTTPRSRVSGRMLRYDASASGLLSGDPLIGFATTLTDPLLANVRGARFTPTTIADLPSSARIASYTPGTLTTIRHILRSTGHFTFIDVAGVPRLHYIYRADSTTPLYIIHEPLNADPAVDLRWDNVGLVDVSTDNPTEYPTPTFSDLFSDTVAPLLSDGLAHVEANGAGSGVQWNGVGTFSNSGNKGYIAPTAGAELLTNGTFAAWTADNPDGWTVSGEVGADPEVSEVGAAEGHGGTGTGAANFFNSATASQPRLTQNVLTVNEFFREQAVVSNRVSGSIRTDFGNQIGLQKSSVGTHDSTRRCMSSASLVILAISTTVDVTIDSTSVKLLTFPQCLRAVAPASAAEPYQKVKLTITADTQAGGVINLDDYTNPLYGIHWWIDRVDGKLYLRKLVNGVWQADSIAGVAVTYSAGAFADVRRIGNNVDVWYNGPWVGTADVSDVPTTNTLMALFATDSGTYFENAMCFPTNGYDHGRYN